MGVALRGRQRAILRSFIAIPALTGLLALTLGACGDSGKTSGSADAARSTTSSRAATTTTTAIGKPTDSDPDRAYCAPVLAAIANNDQGPFYTPVKTGSSMVLDPELKANLKITPAEDPNHAAAGNIVRRCQQILADQGGGAASTDRAYCAAFIAAYHDPGTGLSPEALGAAVRAQEAGVTDVTLRGALDVPGSMSDDAVFAYCHDEVLHLAPAPPIPGATAFDRCVAMQPELASGCYTLDGAPPGGVPAEVSCREIDRIAREQFAECRPYLDG